MSGERADVAASADAERQLPIAWSPPGSAPAPLVPPVAWDELASVDRSWGYHLHALDPLGLPLAAHSHAPDRRWIDYALALASDWLRAHPTPQTGSELAWYDMAIGLRAYRLGYLLDVAARDLSRSDDEVGLLLAGVRTHMEALADEDAFAGHSNHGLYQAAGQLAVARRFPELPGMEPHLEQAERRLRAMIDIQFTDEGLHAEHSPGYHRMVLRALVSIAEGGLIEDPEALERLRRIEEALAWFIRPDGKLVTIGDTDAARIEREPFVRARSDALRFMASGGSEGRPPEGRVRAFERSGYVVFRERWPDGTEDFGDGAHLVQTCAFHSRTHKHADDLSFTWFEHGREVLVDPGRFAYRREGELSPELVQRGFMYGDPRRIYVESTRAHNTVEVDGVSHDRRAEPYGSALRAWGERDGLCWARSAIRLEGSIEHRRLLALLPGRFLLVLDDLRDEIGDPHRFSQRFHAAPELAVKVCPDGVTMSLAERQLHAVALDDAPFGGVAIGIRERQLLGWISRRSGSLEPAPTFSYEREGVAACRFATLFWWGAERPAPISVTDDELSWGVGGATCRLAVAGGAAPRFECRG